MSKKIMSVMLAIFMLASLCVVGLTSASAADMYNPGYRMTGETGGNNYAKAGDTITVTLSVNTNGRYSINAQMELFYDNTKLQFVEDTEEVLWPNLYVAGNSFVYNFNYSAADAPFAKGIHFNYSTLKGVDLTNGKEMMYQYKFKVLEDVNNLNELFCQEFHVFSLYNAAGKPTQGDPSTDVVADDNSGLTDGVTASLVISGGYAPVVIDTAALEALIAEANTYVENGGYTADSIEALKAAIAAAEAVVAAPESQEKVDEQLKALQAAIDALEKEQGPVEIDTTALEALIADAKEYAEKDIYTEESVAALKDAIAAAEAVVAAPESQEKVDEQLKALQAAIDNLVLVPGAVDTRELEKLVAEAKELVEKDGYTEESVAALKDAIAAAEAVLAAPESQEKVDEQLKALQAAIDGLKEVDDTPVESTTTEQATTEKPEAPQTGEASTAVALIVVAIMAAGVVIFARKKATK